MLISGVGIIQKKSTFRKHTISIRLLNHILQLKVNSIIVSAPLDHLGTIFLLHHKSVYTLILTPREAMPRGRTWLIWEVIWPIPWGGGKSGSYHQIVYFDIELLKSTHHLCSPLWMRGCGLRKVMRFAHNHTAGCPTLHTAFAHQAQHFQWLSFSVQFF